MRRLMVGLGAAVVTLVTASGTLAASSPVPGKADRLDDHSRRSYAGRALSGQDASSAAAARSGIRHNFRVLGHLGLPGRTSNGDVWFHNHGRNVGKHAYVGTWSEPCSGTGVKIIDVNDPRHPRLVALAGKKPGESTEDMVVRRIGGRDVLAFGVQPCGEGGRSGLALFDVTDPSNPRSLSFLRTTSGGVHELDMVRRGDGRALALLAVPFAECCNRFLGLGRTGDFWVVDVTDPRHPVKLADWGIIRDSSLRVFAGNDEISSVFQGLGYFAAHYAHSVSAADRGRTAYVSYWDGGVLKFDISRPRRPRLLGRTRFSVWADGDAHSAAVYDYRGRRYILQNDEDFNPLSPTVVTSSATGRRKFQGIEHPFVPTLLTNVGTVSGIVHDAGDGCQARDYRGARGKIALANTVDPGYEGVIPGWSAPCEIGRQVLLAHRAGAKALVSNVVSPDDAYPIEPEADVSGAEGMPVVHISSIDDEARTIRRAIRRGETVRMTLNPSVPAWGFLRVYSEATARDRNHDGTPEYRQVGRFAALPHVTGEITPPRGFQVWSIHNTEVRANRAYSSWYSNGVVALDLTDPRHPRKVGQFVPPPSGRFAEVFGPPFASVWGVAVDRRTGLVYASDERSGLWIVRPTGPAVAD